MIPVGIKQYPPGAVGKSGRGENLRQVIDENITFQSSYPGYLFIFTFVERNIIATDQRPPFIDKGGLDPSFGSLV